jgi:hypothetical protein
MYFSYSSYSVEYINTIRGDIMGTVRTNEPEEVRLEQIMTLLHKQRQNEILTTQFRIIASQALGLGYAESTVASSVLRPLRLAGAYHYAEQRDKGMLVVEWVQPHPLTDQQMEFIRWAADLRYKRTDAEILAKQQQLLLRTTIPSAAPAPPPTPSAPPVATSVAVAVPTTTATAPVSTVSSPGQPGDVMDVMRMLIEQARTLKQRVVELEQRMQQEATAHAEQLALMQQEAAANAARLNQLLEASEAMTATNAGIKAQLAEVLGAREKQDKLLAEQGELLEHHRIMLEIEMLRFAPPQAPSGLPDLMAAAYEVLRA